MPAMRAFLRINSSVQKVRVLYALESKTPQSAVPGW
jgi:hypothetical protein